MSLLNKYYRFHKVAGINIHIENNGEPRYTGCFLNVDGNELTIEKMVAVNADVKELQKQLPANTPIAINITGKGVLIKEIVHKDEPANFAAILPNANLNEFHLQEFRSGRKSFLAMIRIMEATKWQLPLNSLENVIVALSLGPFVVNQVLPQLNFYGTELIFNGHEIHLDKDRNWQNLKYSPGSNSQFAVKIANEKVADEFVLPYAAGFQLALYPAIEMVSTNASDLTSRLEKLIKNKKFKVKGVLALTCTFLLLLVNFLLFSYYNSANNKLVLQVGQTEADADKAQLFEDSIKLKKQLLDSLGWEGKVRKSIMIDQLAQLLPPELKWQQITIDAPEVVESGNDKKHFLARQINVTGVAERITPVNEWLARIRTKSWVRDLKLKNYTFNNEQNTGQFTITIYY